MVDSTLKPHLSFWSTCSTGEQRPLNPQTLLSPSDQLTPWKKLS